MKYFILINQQILSKTNLDIIDGAILDYIYFYCNSQSIKVKKQRITDKDGEIWTWVDYQSLSIDMPMIKIKSIGAITPRIKKIENAGYIRTKRYQHLKKYFQMTAKADGLFIQVNEAIHIGEQGYSPKRIAPIHIGELIKIKEEIKIKDKEDNTKEALVLQKTEFGNPSINRILSHLKEKFDLKALDGSERTNRRYAWLLIKKIGGEQNLAGLEKLIEFAAGNDWWSTRITSTKDLYYNVVKIVQQAKNKGRNLVAIID